MTRNRTTLTGLALLALSAPALAFNGAPTALVDEHADEEHEAEQDSYVLLQGGDVYTGTGAILRGASLLTKNGVIEEIGFEVEAPDGAQVLDVRGLRLYPGLVALSASSRITEGAFAPADAIEEPGYDPELDVASGDEWDFDALENEDPFAPSDLATRTTDSFDPFSTYLVLTLGAGITTVEQGSAAIKLRRYTIDDIVMRDGFQKNLSFGSADAKRKLRQNFLDARKYLDDMRLWEEGDEEGEEPSKRGINSSVLSVLQGKSRASFNANDREDLLGIARLAQDFGFRPTIEGCREGWIVADELGRAGATAIITARDRQWKPDLQVAEGGSSIENAALLHAAGVQVAVKPLSGSIDLGGIAGRDLLALPIEAGFAVRGGLSNEAALAAITIVPARILGVDHRIGTLEVGKDADVLVTDGDLLHYETFVQFAFVGGELVYDKNEELFYSHIRPMEGRSMTTAGEDAEDHDGEGHEEGHDGEGDDDGDGEEEEESDEDEGGDDDGR